MFYSAQVDVCLGWHHASLFLKRTFFEKMDARRNTDSITEQNGLAFTEIAAIQKASIIDAMAEVQGLEKPDWIKNCSHLACCFTAQIFQKCSDSDEMRLIFDRLVIYYFRLTFPEHYKFC